MCFFCLWAAYVRKKQQQGKEAGKEEIEEEKNINPPETSFCFACSECWRHFLPACCGMEWLRAVLWRTFGIRGWGYMEQPAYSISHLVLAAMWCQVLCCAFALCWVWLDSGFIRFRSRIYGYCTLWQ